ncbi:PAS domain S-box protein [Helicobacter suis]|uniref:PAS domain S-box protein n=1 Tax=Helicobacter suis TaxID=104628 RepID=UPI002493C83F|nr:PAS domain S-box protein [Helicobacter suis]
MFFRKKPERKPECDCVAKDELFELRSVYKAINDSSAMIEFDLDHHVINANANFLKLPGYSLEELKGKSHEIFSYQEYVKSPEYLKFWNTLRSGQHIQGIFERLTKSGKAIYLEASYTPVVDVQGKLY